jgi:hypothetical protein
LPHVGLGNRTSCAIGLRAALSSRRRKIPNAAVVAPIGAPRMRTVVWGVPSAKGHRDERCASLWPGAFLARTFSRRVLGEVFTGFLLTSALAGRFGAPDARARKSCGRCRTRQKGKCKGRKPDGTRCSPDKVCQRGQCRSDLCKIDGIKNGAETDIDCGGSCRRCAPGKICTGRNDCATALCPSGTCQACTVNTQCGSDANGPFVCVTDRFTGPHASCASCRGGDALLHLQPRRNLLLPQALRGALTVPSTIRRGSC